ncbi:hypothetical protein EC957_001915 [Mortierella hygrophila]|uniref:Uncharacterized protein n=1 Tax=Mortierella hygrophila TaxID=979708 RepID=A0A9P6K1X6_9FUNG|nr:hypothetical protein EC957_001915 [Mortierella hygrophila]
MYTQSLKLLPDFSAMKTDIDPTLLNDNVWKSESGDEAMKKAQVLLVIEILKDLDKSNKEQGPEDLDMSKPERAAIFQHEYEVAVSRVRNELKNFEVLPRP